ncbi:hypothetical protein WA158_004358 [Blastocystis sp. Blastoise]
MTCLSNSSFPYKAVLALTFAQFSSYYITRFISADINTITKILLPDIQNSEIGYYSGYLISIYYISNIFGSLFWGILSDHSGRRKLLLIIFPLMTILILIFSFIQNYWLALTIRFIWGFVDGSVGLVKTTGCEVCDDATMSLCMSYLMFGVGLGGAIGPIVGGYLIDIHNTFPQLIVTFPFLKTYPFFLPSLFGAILMILSTVFLYCAVPETLVKNSKQDIEASSSNSSNSISVPLITMTPPSSPRTGSTIKSRASQVITFIKNYKNCLLSLFIYLLAAYNQSSFDAVLPLWLSRPLESRGFNMSTMEYSLEYLFNNREYYWNLYHKMSYV